MTWKNYDPIDKMHLYKGVVPTEGVTIPTTDDIAWEHFRHYRWIYNKLEIAESPRAILWFSTNDTRSVSL